MFFFVDALTFCSRFIKSLRIYKLLQEDRHDIKIELTYSHCLYKPNLQMLL